MASRPAKRMEGAALSFWYGPNRLRRRGKLGASVASCYFGSAQAGVFAGNAATGDLDPTDVASRAEAVKVSVRLMELVEGLGD